MPFSVVTCLLLLLPPAAAMGGTPADSIPCAGFEFLPGSELVPVLLAHPQEPRVGVRKEAGNSQLKLDIGATMDVVAFSLDSGRIAFAAGVDFFTYALTTSNEGLRLQVDAVDGFFGGHVSVAFPGENATFQLRLRLMHLSAHMVDGHYDPQGEGWKDGREPLPFTRDFGELAAAVRTALAAIPFRIYSGFSYATLIRPSEIKRFSMLFGLEVFSETLLPDLMDKDVTLYVASHLTLAGIPAYAGTTNIETGIKFGPMYGRGVRLYAGYTSGPEIFSQYYDLRTTVWGVGFSFDAW
jgi:hypothetical protein